MAAAAHCSRSIISWFCFIVNMGCSTGFTTTLCTKPDNPDYRTKAFDCLAAETLSYGPLPSSVINFTTTLFFPPSSNTTFSPFPSYFFSNPAAR